MVHFTGNVTQLAECLPCSMNSGVEPQCSIKLSLVDKPCDSSTWEVEAERREVPGHLWLYKELQASLDYMKVYLKKTKKTHLFSCPRAMRRYNCLLQNRYSKVRGPPLPCLVGPTVKLFFSPHPCHMHLTSVLSLLVWKPGPTYGHFDTARALLR